MNRLTHGLRSEKTVLPGEDPAEFEAILQGWFESYSPDAADSIAEYLLAETGLAHWQLKRARKRREDIEWNLPGDAAQWTEADQKSFDKFTRYKTTAERTFFRWFKEVERHYNRLHREENARQLALAKFAALELKALNKEEKEQLAKELRLEQVVEVEVLDGQCSTSYYPPNEELVEIAENRARLPLYVERCIVFPDGIVPAEYAWTESCRMPGEDYAAAIQKVTWNNWRKLADYEKTTETNHATSAWHILGTEPGPKRPTLRKLESEPGTK
jgi:hypothetical protein